mmetsp:Transcript_34713/g.103758  ORF Transcript_34713/g.103758 Transcript_34713/m.103758 type:complete len:95 (+) Transcript_34713:225-509(+)
MHLARERLQLQNSPKAIKILLIMVKAQDRGSRGIAEITSEATWAIFRHRSTNHGRVLNSGDIGIITSPLTAHGRGSNALNLRAQGLRSGGQALR